MKFKLLEHEGFATVQGWKLFAKFFSDTHCITATKNFDDHEKCEKFCLKLGGEWTETQIKRKFETTTKEERTNEG